MQPMSVALHNVLKDREQMGHELSVLQERIAMAEIRIKNLVWQEADYGYGDWVVWTDSRMRRDVIYTGWVSDVDVDYHTGELRYYYVMASSEAQPNPFSIKVRPTSKLRDREVGETFPWEPQAKLTTELDDASQA